MLVNFSFKNSYQNSGFNKIQQWLVLKKRSLSKIKQEDSDLQNTDTKNHEFGNLTHVFAT